MSGKLSDRLRLESALDLQRRLPPNMIEAHVSKMIDIVSRYRYLEVCHAITTIWSVISKTCV